jgi:hypothetical protein
MAIRLKILLATISILSSLSGCGMRYKYQSAGGYLYKIDRFTEDIWCIDNGYEEKVTPAYRGTEPPVEAPTAPPYPPK